MFRVFAAEDDERMRAELADLLAKNGYECALPDGFEDLRGQILSSGCDLVLLDLGLPVMDGLAVLRELRSASEVPVLILTSRESDVDELMGMHYGADDYVTKPFNAQILLARIESILRRAYRTDAAPAVLNASGIALDLARGVAAGPAGEAALTKNEQGILACLMRRAGQIVRREDIMEELWQSESFVDDNTLTVNVTRLRSKLRSIGADGVIKTRRGQGYQL